MFLCYIRLQTVQKTSRLHNLLQCLFGYYDKIRRPSTLGKSKVLQSLPWLICLYVDMISHVDQFIQILQTIQLYILSCPIMLQEHTTTCEEFKSLYPAWNDFLEIRQRYDPRGMFLNHTLRRLFGVKQCNRTGTSTSPPCQPLRPTDK